MVLSDQDSCLGWLLQNFALNVAEHGFKISVYNRSYEKTEAAVKRANKEGKRCDADISLLAYQASSGGCSSEYSAVFAGLGDNLHGYKDLKEFVGSLKKPR